MNGIFVMMVYFLYQADGDGPACWSLVNPHHRYESLILRVLALEDGRASGFGKSTRRILVKHDVFLK